MSKSCKPRRIPRHAAADESRAAGASTEDAVVRLPRTRRPQPAVELARTASVVLGQLTGRTDTGDYLVAYEGCPANGVPARSTVDVRIEDIGKEVTLVFVDGDPARPVISGLLGPDPQQEGDGAPRKRISVSIDGERLVFSAHREIVLQCGKSSLVLRRDGKVVLRGADVLSRSSGGNRIKGSVVLLN